MLTLLLGPAGVGKTSQILKEIAENVKNKIGGNVYLVHEKYSHEAEREVCEAAGNTLSEYGKVLTFKTLIREVQEQCGGARVLTDNATRLLCMAQTVNSLHPNLKIYADASENSNMLIQMLRTVDELKENGISDEQLRISSLKEEDELGHKLREIRMILTAFNAKQSELGADEKDALTEAAEKLEETDFVSSRFYIDGFSDFSVPQKKIIEELLKLNVPVTICLNCEKEEKEVFNRQKATYYWLIELAGQNGIKTEEIWFDETDNNNPIRYYSDRIFSYTRENTQNNNDAIHLVAAGDPYEECETAAAEILDLVRETGCRWNDIAIAVKGFEEYRTAIESACDRYGIPVFISGRRNILQKSIPMTISCAIRSVLNGYDYDSVFGYLKTGFSGIDGDELDELENYVILWSVRGNMWKKDFIMHPDGYNKKNDEESEALLQRINKTRAKAIGPLSVLEVALEEAKTARECAAALADFLIRINLPESLKERAKSLRELGRLDTAMEYERLWNVVCNALENFAETLGDEPMNSLRFQTLWEMMLSQYDVTVIPASLDVIQIGELNRMKKRHLKHLFVLGVTDESLPKPEESKGLFSSFEREILKDRELTLENAKDDMDREYGNIYECFSLPSESLTLLRPLVDFSGEPTRMSLVAKRAQELFGIEEAYIDVIEARISVRKTAKELAVLAEAGDINKYTVAAREYFAQQGESETISKLAEAALKERGKLKAESVKALYGKQLNLSPSSAERFNMCRFSYFMQYGLKAKPREKASFDQRDYGTFMHSILENVVKETMQIGGFKNISKENVLKMADCYIDEYIQQELKDFSDKSPRFIYLFNRLRKTVRTVCGDMWEELSVSDFEPLETEFNLRKLGTDKDAGLVGISGIVDRIDTWEHNGVTYLRVTDYKTGKKDFKLSDVCRGMNMQMLIYLFALKNSGKSLCSTERVQPAGVLYVPARVNLTPEDHEPTEEELEKIHKDSARRKGLILSDPVIMNAMENTEEKRFLPIRKTRSPEDPCATAEQWDALEIYIQKTMDELGKALLEGSIDANPWATGGKTESCELCDFRDACQFDKLKDNMRNYKNLKSEEAWSIISNA